MPEPRSKASAEAPTLLELDRARWQAVLDTARDAIVSIDAAGIVTLFNRAAEDMFGYHADEVWGRNVSMLMPSPYREEHDTCPTDLHALLQQPRRAGRASACKPPGASSMLTIGRSPWNVRRLVGRPSSFGYPSISRLQRNAAGNEEWQFRASCLSLLPSHLRLLAFSATT